MSDSEATPDAGTGAGIDACGGSAGDAGSDGIGVDCTEAVLELYTYLDGELTDERRVEISVHLDLCSPCADAADFEKELRAVIANRCTEHVPDSLKQRIAEALNLEAARAPSSPGGAGAPGATA